MEGRSSTQGGGRRTSPRHGDHGDHGEEEDETLKVVGGKMHYR